MTNDTSVKAQNSRETVTMIDAHQPSGPFLKGLRKVLASLIIMGAVSGCASGGWDIHHDIHVLIFGVPDEVDMRRRDEEDARWRAEFDRMRGQTPPVDYDAQSRDELNGQAAQLADLLERLAACPTGATDPYLLKLQENVREALFMIGGGATLGTPTYSQLQAVAHFVKRASDYARICGTLPPMALNQPDWMRTFWEESSP